MQTREKPLGLTIRPAGTSDVRTVWDLEQTLSPFRERAEELGFLLPATLQEYEQLAETAILNIAELDDRFVGFLLALPPAHPRLAALLGLKVRFHLESQDLLELPDLAWIAKVAVLPEHSRTGIASALYVSLFEQLSTSPMMTATLIEPLRNIPSAEFHRKMGFRQIGTFDGGNREGLQNMLNSIVLRLPG